MCSLLCRNRTLGSGCRCSRLLIELFLSYRIRSDFRITAYRHFLTLSHNMASLDCSTYLFSSPMHLLALKSYLRCSHWKGSSSLLSLAVVPRPWAIQSILIHLNNFLWIFHKMASCLPCSRRRFLSLSWCLYHSPALAARTPPLVKAKQTKDGVSTS